ncbi:MAG: oxaloacetate decarboxylase [Oscillospiraceae bacterium]|nr:oxaloacetate decarboxylase [Oscillospiraceae bacterium]
MNTALIMACLGIMLKGMVGIFAVIIAIWGLVALLNKMTGEKK